MIFDLWEWRFQPLKHGRPSVAVQKHRLSQEEEGQN